MRSKLSVWLPVCLPVWCLLAPFAAAQDGLQAGAQLYDQGKYGEAAAVLRQAEGHAQESPELQYNLALASWRAGDLAAAETAIEKYAALSKASRVDLHAGLLGAVRFDEARLLEASADAAAAGGVGGPAGVPAGAPAGASPPSPPPDPLPLLEQALVKARQAQAHFVRGAVAAESAELRRNVERSLRYVAALQKKIDELKKQREEQQDQQDDEQDQDGEKDKDGEQEEGDDKQKGEESSDPSEQGEPKPDEKQSGEQSEQPGESEPSQPQESDPNAKPEQGSPGSAPEEAQPPEPQPEPSKPSPEPNKTPQPQGEAEPEPEPAPQPADEKPAPQEAAPPRGDAPGELTAPRELSPEQTQRLLELLQQLDGKLEGLKTRAHSRRPKVEKDW